ncbi:KH domain-containing protein [Sporolactobacillus putidus]|uniref:RNA-binding protein KhpA n=1 Tax=Sporolactobacillus putidus TaxID=492735 RepID=A0A917RZG8_9BACL|nr:KH domain-containing protein [Sporolactobacillus putidus]GGL44223.1 UPF0109 protein [Sporolactobacillus putidus]
MDELIKAMVVPLIVYPDDIQIQRQEDAEHITYVLAVNKKDMGRVIGKNGRVAEALRTIVSAAGSARGKSVQFLIRE